MFPKTKLILLKVVGYKPATFVKLNSSQVTFKDFSYKYLALDFYNSEHLYARNNSGGLICFMKINFEKTESFKKCAMFLVHY